MVWGAISWQTLGPIFILKGKGTAQKYLDNISDQLHSMVLDDDAIFEDDYAPTHTSRCTGSWFENHENEVKHPPWPVQSPELNIILPVWGIRRVCSHNTITP